jgi:peptidase M28-like protein
VARHEHLVRTAILAAFAAALGTLWLFPVACLAESPVTQTTLVTGIKKEPPVDPGQSFKGPLAELTAHETSLAAALRKDVERLAGDIGERSMNRYAKLIEAAAFIEKSLGDDGFKVERQTYEVRGRKCANLEVEIKGTKAPTEIFVVGAHYDSAPGVAALLALGRAVGGKPTGRTLRLVAFTNEEPPYFQEPGMGSLHYAKRCKERKENIVGMISVETIGYYTDAPDSQHYPPPLGMIYPSTGNFIAFVASPQSDSLVRDAAASFRRHAKFPSQWGTAPAFVPGVGWSDHWSFWEQGYQAIMITDTALFRYPHYHKATDTPDKLDYPRMARVVAGIEEMVGDLVGAGR